MAQRSPKATAETSGVADRDQRPYPPDAYAYDDDVTPAAVQTLRESVPYDLNSPGWKVIDGFGVVINV